MSNNALRVVPEAPMEAFEGNTLGARLAELKKKAHELRQSRFAAQAAFMVACTVIAKAVGFFGTAYAARCLGPFNMGVSGLVLAMVQQVAVIYNGGFDIVAVRIIAVNPARCPTIVRTVLTFRLGLVLIVGLAWAPLCLAIQSERTLSTWMMGIPILFLSASALTFAFQGMEHLPVQNLINAGGTLTTAAAYFLFFSYPMKIGSDLIVVIGVNCATLLFSHVMYRRLTSQWAFGMPDLKTISLLIRESWRYWLLALLTFYYSLFQVPLISLLVGVREAGLYRVAFTMADGVWTLFNAINVLLLPRLSVWYRKGSASLGNRQRQLFWLFCLIGLPPIVALIAFAGSIFQKLLGPAYVGSITLFRVLVFGRFIAFLSQVYLFGLAAGRQDNMFLAIIAVACGFSLLAGIISVKLFGMIGAAVVSSLTELIILIMSVVASKRIVARDTIRTVV